MAYLTGKGTLTINKNFVEENRAGRFKVSNDLIYTSPDELMFLFSKMIVYHTDDDLRARTIEYHAYSPLFEALPNSVLTPEYRIVVNIGTDEDGKMTRDFTAVRMDKINEGIRVIKIKRNSNAKKV